MSPTRTHRSGPRTPAEVKERLDFADGALGAAGHEVTDPQLNELARRVAAGTLSADAAVSQTISIITSR